MPSCFTGSATELCPTLLTVARHPQPRFSGCYGHYHPSQPKLANLTSLSQRWSPSPHPEEILQIKFRIYSKPRLPTRNQQCYMLSGFTHELSVTYIHAPISAWFYWGHSQGGEEFQKEASPVARDSLNLSVPWIVFQASIQGKTGSSPGHFLEWLDIRGVEKTMERRKEHSLPFAGGGTHR